MDGSLDLPDDWPAACTPYDANAISIPEIANWDAVDGLHKGDETVLLVHRQSQLKFRVVVKEWLDGAWRLCTICVNPPRQGIGRMHSLAQEAMRLYLGATGSTAEIEAAEAEFWAAEVTGQIH